MAVDGLSSLPEASGETVTYSEEAHKYHESLSMLEMESPENISDPRRKALRIRLEGMLSGSTISGISQAFSDRKGKYKLFWITLFVLGVIGFTINFYYVTERFIKRPILTQLDRSSKPFKWPHLTFCNPSNPIPFWQSDSLFTSWNKTFTKAHKYHLPRYGHHERKIWEHYVALASIDPAKFFQHEQTGMIFKIQIVYQKSTVSSSSGTLDQYHDITNTPGIFKSRLDSIRSPIPCYTLMPEKISEALSVTHKVLAIKLYLIMDFRSYKLYNYGYESRKLYFYITNPDTTLQSSFPNYILAGTDSFFTIKLRTHQRVTNCIKEKFTVRLYDAKMISSHEYVGGYDDCRTSLSQRLYLKKCGCFNPHLPLYQFEDHQPRLCTNMSHYNTTEMRKNIECLNKVMYDDMKSPHFKFHLAADCSKFAQHSCTSESYEITRNSNAWQDDMNDLRRKYMTAASRSLPNARSSGEQKDNPRNLSEKFVRRNLIILNIVASKQSTESTYEEFEYPLSQFMSDFGGAIGLWIGLSVISFFEIMELVLVFIKYLRS